MAIHKYLDVSTAHIKAKDAERLHDKPDTDQVLMWTTITHEYGWWLHVPSDAQDLAQLVQRLRTAGYSNSFTSLLIEAHSKDCFYINLDQDGPVEDNLPVFEW